MSVKGPQALVIDKITGNCSENTSNCDSENDIETGNHEGITGYRNKKAEGCDPTGNNDVVQVVVGNYHDNEDKSMGNYQIPASKHYPVRIAHPVHPSMIIKVAYASQSLRLMRTSYMNKRDSSI